MRSAVSAVPARNQSAPSPPISTSWTPSSDTETVFERLRAGTPSSVTRTLNVYVPGGLVSSGVQVKAPESGSMTAFAGRPTRLNVMALPSPLTRSGSMAFATNSTGEPGAHTTARGTPRRDGPFSPPGPPQAKAIWGDGHTRTADLADLGY